MSVDTCSHGFLPTVCPTCQEPDLEFTPLPGRAKPKSVTGDVGGSPTTFACVSEKHAKALEVVEAARAEHYPIIIDTSTGSTTTMAQRLEYRCLCGRLLNGCPVLAALAAFDAVQQHEPEPESMRARRAAGYIEAVKS